MELDRKPPAAIGFGLHVLDAILRARIPGLEGALRVRPVHGGQSNPTYFLSYGNRDLVLRKKPPGTILPSAHAVDREYRVLTALAGTGVPVPKTLFYHADPAAVGTPFFVMERLDGRVGDDPALPDVAPADRRDVYCDMARTLARLHRADWRALGLEGFGREGNYYERQLGRMANQWRQWRGGSVQAMDRLIRWLEAHLPAEGSEPVAIYHGDFRVGNLMLHPTEPRIVGVLDWELSTLGPPLADLAFTAISWRVPPSDTYGVKGLDLAAARLPSEAEFLDWYYEAKGDDARAQPFHFAFALFRLAVLLEGIGARARAGNAFDERASAVAGLSVAFVHHALDAAGESRS